MLNQPNKANNNFTSREAKTGGVPNRGSLYAVAAAYSKVAIDTLYELMKNSKNEGIRLGAAKAILNKSLPDLKQSNDLECEPELLISELSPELEEAMLRLTSDWPEADLIEKFSPGMVELVLERRREEAVKDH